MCFPFGVVFRFRAVFAEHITLRPYREQLLKFVLLLGKKRPGTHIVVVFLVVTECLREHCRIDVLCVYIYIYIERERDREKEGEMDTIHMYGNLC